MRRVVVQAGGGPGLRVARDNIRGDNMMELLAPANVYSALATPGIWIGAAVGIALIAVAIWLRRTRIETSN